MKKITFLLMGLLLFACSNAPMTSASVDAEEDWNYGNFSAGHRFTWNDAGEQVAGDVSEYVNTALIYERDGKRFFQQCSFYPIPTVEFKGNKAEYEDSEVKLIIEKNGDRFYVEMTAPRFYHKKEDYYAKKHPDFLKVFTTKHFLYRY